jgi:hypothetical protein
MRIMCGIRQRPFTVRYDSTGPPVVTTEPKGEQRKKKSLDVWKTVLSSVSQREQIPKMWTIGAPNATEIGSMHVSYMLLVLYPSYLLCSRSVTKQFERPRIIPSRTWPSASNQETDEGAKKAWATESRAPATLSFIQQTDVYSTATA